MSLIRLTSTYALLVLGCGAGAGLSAQQYTFQSIEYKGQSSNKFGTFPTGVNNKGTVAGYIQFTNGTRECDEGFLAYSNGQFSPPLNDPDGQPCKTWGASINDSGEVVGYYNGTSQIHGFLEKDGVYTTFDTGDGPSTFITAVDDAGDFAGFFGNWPATTNHGFLSKGGVVSQIDFPGVPASTTVRGMDASGGLAGCTYGLSYPFFRTPDGKFVQFTIAHEVFGCATGIRSELGLVVGFFNNGTRNLGFVLDYRNPASQPDPLTGAVKVTPILYPGSSQTQVWGMNALGQLVGDAYVDGHWIGFIATPPAQPAN